MELLVHAGLAVPVEGPSEPDSDDCALAGWSFHDLLFHSRSRPGMHDYPIGRTYPLRGKTPPLPAVPPQRGERRSLPRAEGHRPYPSLDSVLERRRSIRVHSKKLITVAALGEFLDQSARLRHTVPADPEKGILYESSVRPYPSGGGAYELEIYVVANRCAGLDPGVYHYAADAHALDRVAPAGRRTAALLADAARFGALRGEPQVLLLITARFARLSWKYSGMAYAMMLKNVGVLYQTMYLVATAMNLAPCALGTGNPALMTRVLNLPYAEESSVGEFLLGVE
jgi:SagB-type dehydrogenase family enzyme